ncbi:MAG: hypothetical protein OXH51_10715 [Gemmatimonadetes bacterium]|nr:hypothetical protein [Gemmatimonadota bacterium]
MEPQPELSGVWFDSFVLNGLRSEWTLAIEEVDGRIDGRYRVFDFRHGVYPVEGDIEGDHGYPNVRLALSIYKKHPLECHFEGTVRGDFEGLSGVLGCYNADNVLVYGTPINFERLKGLDE